MLFLLDYKMAISVTILMKTNEFCSMLVFVYSVPYADNDMTPHLPKKSTDMTEVTKYLMICTYLYYLGEHSVTKAGSCQMDIP